jgi:hypothetical protein
MANIVHSAPAYHIFPDVNNHTSYVPGGAMMLLRRAGDWQQDYEDVYLKHHPLIPALSFESPPTVPEESRKTKYNDSPEERHQHVHVVHKSATGQGEDRLKVVQVPDKDDLLAARQRRTEAAKLKKKKRQQYLEKLSHAR